MSDYQLFQPLRPEEYAALKADIAARGVLVPVEVDQDGNILDGHHRVQIAEELGIDHPKMVRTFETEDAKVEHILKVNLLRRQMGPIAWAEAFKRLADVRGVANRLNHAGRPKGNADTVSALAEEMGVTARTARRRLKLADDLAEDPDLAEAVDCGEKDSRRAQREVRERRAKERNEALVEAGRRDPTAGGTWDVYDHWTSPMLWLLHEARSVKGAPHMFRPHRMDYLDLLTRGSLRDVVPAEVVGDPVAEAAREKARTMSEDLRREAQKRERDLLEFIRDGRRQIAEALRGAAGSLSSEPTVLVGRQSVNGDSSHGQMDLRLAGIETVVFRHEVEGCECGNALPLGCRDGKQTGRDHGR